VPLPFRVRALTAEPLSLPAPEPAPSMADEHDIPPGVRDILDHMPREMRQRVLADYGTHYAPFLGMLAGWKGAVQEHYVQAERSAVARLEEQFFPLGRWHFPAQSLAVPRRPPERTSEMPSNTVMTDSGGLGWLPSGEVWLQPTALRTASVRPTDTGIAVVVDADYCGQAGPGHTDFILRRGQLAFVAAPEETLAAMERGAWWVLTPGARWRPARLTRHDGGMEFEREMQTARMSQRHLDLWLPPFHPYGRKMVCLQLAEDADAGPPPPGLGPVGRDLSTGFRFAGFVPDADPASAALRALDTGGGGDPFVLLNAIPVIQSVMTDHIFYPPFPRVGQEYALRVSGVSGIFAAVVLNAGLATPASLTRLPSLDRLAPEPDVQVQFPQGPFGLTQVKLYHGSRGAFAAADAPTSLDSSPLRFDLPFPPLGGATVGGPEDRAAWARTAWYHSVLRPPLLTEGDLRELIGQRQAVVGRSLSLTGAARGIVHDPDAGGLHWGSYLWPSILAREEGFGGDGAVPTPDSVPLIQKLALTFARTEGAALPGFLLADMANYLASVLSQYFVLSTFRIEGRVAGEGLTEGLREIPKGTFVEGPWEGPQEATGEGSGKRLRKISREGRAMP